MKNTQRSTSVFVAGLALCCGLVAGLAQAQTIGREPSLNDASGKGAVAVFKNFTQYPPESRPLSTSNWDLLHPWLTETASLPMISRPVMRQMDALRASGMTEDEVWRNAALPVSIPRYHFEMNKTVLAGTQDELRAQLTVTPSESGAPLRFHVTDAEIIGDSAFGSPRAGRPAFSCEAATCAFHWKAPSAQKQYWGAMELTATVVVEGMADDFVIRQPFYSSPMVAGKFTGQFQERLENGSLVVEAGVEVQKRMACFVSANLFSQDRQAPTHHVERRMIVDPSMKTIAFTFFCKIFRDFGHEGAFRLQDLKGQCENLSYPPEWFMDSELHQEDLQKLQNKPTAAREPTRIYFEYDNLVYTTHRYANTVFSDKEWQSPESQRKLEMYKKSAEELDNPAMELRKQKLQRQQPK